MCNPTTLPFWFSYRDAEFIPKPLGFEAVEALDRLSEYEGLGCPLCGEGVYRVHEGTEYVTCDNHRFKQKLRTLETLPDSSTLIL